MLLATGAISLGGASYAATGAQATNISIAISGAPAGTSVQSIKYDDPTTAQFVVETADPATGTFAVPTNGSSLGITLYSDIAGQTPLSCGDSAQSPAVNKYGLLQISPGATGVTMSRKDDGTYICKIGVPKPSKPSGGGGSASNAGLQTSTPQDFITDAETQSAMAQDTDNINVNKGLGYILDQGSINFSNPSDESGVHDLNISEDLGNKSQGTNRIYNWTKAINQNFGAAGIFSFEFLGSAGGKGVISHIDQQSENQVVNAIVVGGIDKSGNPLQSVASYDNSTSKPWHAVGFDLESEPVAPKFWNEASAVSIANGLPMGNFTFSSNYDYSAIQSLGPLYAVFSSMYDVAGKRTDSWAGQDHACTIQGNGSFDINHYCPEGVNDDFATLQAAFTTAQHIDTFDNTFNGGNILNLWSKTHFHTLWAVPMSGTANDNAGNDIGYDKSMTLSYSGSDAATVEALLAKDSNYNYWKSAVTLPLRCSFNELMPNGKYADTCLGTTDHPGDVVKFLKSNCSGTSCNFGDFVKYEAPKDSGLKVVDLCAAHMENPASCKAYGHITEEYSNQNINSQVGAAIADSPLLAHTNLGAILPGGDLGKAAKDYSYDNILAMLSLTGQIKDWEKQQSGFDKVGLGYSFYAFESMSNPGLADSGVTQHWMPFYSGNTRYYTNQANQPVDVTGAPAKCDKKTGKCSNAVVEDNYTDSGNDIWHKNTAWQLLTNVER